MPNAPRARGSVNGPIVPGLDLPGTPAVLRRLNQIQVLRAVRSQGTTSRAEIAAMTGLSKVTVSQVVGDLLGAGVVRERLESPADRENRVGRRARVVSFRPEAHHVLGIDIGATQALILVADLAGRIVQEKRLAVSAASTREERLDAIRAAAHDAVRQAGLAMGDISAVGVGTPGIVAPSTGGVTLAPQLPGWESIPLADELALGTDCPVVVANEVQLAVLGEQWLGAAAGVQHVAYLHIGVGVGLGIITHGDLHQGASGAAGEIGYLALGLPDDPRRPPQTGRFEWLVGGPAYERRAAELIDAGRGLGLLSRSKDGTVSAECVYRAAADGDPDANSIVDEVTDITALGIAGLVTILDPELVIIGGGISRAGEGLLALLRAKVARLLPRSPRIAGSSLGDEAVAIGAIRVALDQWDAAAFSLASPSWRE